MKKKLSTKNSIEMREIIEKQLVDIEAKFKESYERQKKKRQSTCYLSH